MRIISGDFKGKKLASLRGTATRPTADRVRESIFNIRAAEIQNSAVLDLFAGTGALGLEALSRGAASAVFIDSEIPAVKTIQKNIDNCRVNNRARVIRWDIRRNLNCLSPAIPVFDLVFMDPPYNANFMTVTLTHLSKQGVLKHNASIIVEHASMEPIVSGIAGFELTDQRIYGKTVVSFLRR
ncbi:MAG: 16S rRNA (guanine(966)-N(2))-methyltransferase RsmD [Desulfobacteraceae bacterium]|nr:MAG: 16S rRNA (guanine(966)-N(2))-methyltransferase RsmD [Desulfobacteraceae bacterium]